MVRKSVEIRALAKRCREMRQKLGADEAGKQFESLAHAFEQLEGMARELERQALMLERQTAAKLPKDE